MDRPPRRGGSHVGKLIISILALGQTLPASASSHPYTLDSGEVRIAGETNVFPFSGRSVRFEGCVRPQGRDLYRGEIRVAMDSFVFDVPFASEVVGSETQFDTARFPYVNLSLGTLHPVPGRQRLDGVLELRGERRPVKIAVDVAETDAGISVQGAMELRQSDFGVTPFDWGILRVADEVRVEFQASFAAATEQRLLAAASTDPGVSCFQ